MQPTGGCSFCSPLAVSDHATASLLTLSLLSMWRPRRRHIRRYAMKRIEIHPVNPQPRLIGQVAAQFQTGALVALPTDASYVLACHLEDRQAVERLRQVRA